MDAHLRTLRAAGERFELVVVADDRAREPKEGDVGDACLGEDATFLPVLPAERAILVGGGGVRLGEEDGRDRSHAGRF